MASVQKGSLKWETESLLSAPQKQALNISLVRKIDHKDVANKRKLCEETHGKNVMHIVVVASQHRKITGEDTIRYI